MDYGVYEWRLTDAKGKLITNITVFSTDAILFTVTNYTKFKMEGAVIKGYIEQKLQEKSFFLLKTAKRRLQK